MQCVRSKTPATAPPVLRRCEPFARTTRTVINHTKFTARDHDRAVNDGRTSMCTTCEARDADPGQNTQRLHNRAIGNRGACRGEGGRGGNGTANAHRTPPPQLLTNAKAGAAVQLPAAAARRPSAVAVSAALLGSRLAAASQRPDRLRDAASGIAHVSRGIGARLAQCAAGHGRDSDTW